MRSRLLLLSLVAFVLVESAALAQKTRALKTAIDDGCQRSSQLLDALSAQRRDTGAVGRLLGGVTAIERDLAQCDNDPLIFFHLLDMAGADQADALKMVWAMHDKYEKRREQLAAAITNLEAFS